MILFMPFLLCRFVICHGARLALDAAMLYRHNDMERYYHQECGCPPFSIAVLTHVVDILLDLSNATSFFVYCLLQQDFRENLEAGVQKFIIFCSDISIIPRENPFRIKSTTNGYRVYTVDNPNGLHFIDLV